ncbi:MAG: hypothetical protein IBJ10_02625 [Phycisphaerales bacterium]|nr:hypothetical protein [Phycisphaerales bacterium]
MDATIDPTLPLEELQSQLFAAALRGLLDLANSTDNDQIKLRALTEIARLCSPRARAAQAAAAAASPPPPLETPGASAPPHAPEPSPSHEPRAPRNSPANPITHAPNSHANGAHTQGRTLAAAGAVQP